MGVERSRPHVLLVDDSPDNRDLYAKYLSFCGLRVELAGSGLEAIDKAVELLPSVIVMDLSMPGMDGWRATRWLKARAATRRIPVIALTGHALVGAEKDARAAGCDDYVAKPCLPEALLDRLLLHLPAAARRSIRSGDVGRAGSLPIERGAAVPRRRPGRVRRGA